MNEVNVEALANQANALQSHRGGTGEMRYAAVEICRRGRARRPACSRPATTLVVRAALSRRARDRAAGVPGRASSTSTPAWSSRRRRRRPARRARRRSTATATIECRFRAAAAAAAAVRAAPVDHRQPSAGVLRRRHRRAAVRGQRPGQRRRRPGRRGRRSGVAAVRVRAPRRHAGRGATPAMTVSATSCSSRSRTAARPATSCAPGWSAGCSSAHRRLPRSCCVSPLVKDPAFVREFDATARAVRGSAAASARRPRRRGCWR